MDVQNQVVSIQEAATKFVKDILGNINSAVTEIAGVDVLWFRAQPDKRSQDVIFQSYTLYGVEDCPLSFKAIYDDSGYDDAAITYNIMGINFNVPMTLDIAVDIWKEATGNDGTIPQKGDIVFIPMTRKLMEIVSMQPVKKLGGQLTSYKVNLSIYTPTRSRLVGEQLKDSIKNNTTNLMERFGDDIKTNIENIVDDNQLSLFDSTSKDKHKNVEPNNTEESIQIAVRSIVSYDLVVDGHTVARNYYKENADVDTIVEYKKKDSFTSDDQRCLSCWFRLDAAKAGFKNIKDGMIVSAEDGDYYIITKTGNKFKENDNVVVSRGVIRIPGVIVGKGKIKVNGDYVTKLSKTYPGWENMPGFTITFDNNINLLNSDSFSISIKGGMISISANGDETLITIQEDIANDKWYGVIINIGDKFNVDLFTEIDSKLTKVASATTENEIYDSVDVEKYYIKKAGGSITNIRLYDVFNNEIDKQLTDLVSYNVKNNKHAIINDSADTYLNNEYIGRQR